MYRLRLLEVGYLLLVGILILKDSRSLMKILVWEISVRGSTYETAEIPYLVIRIIWPQVKCVFPRKAQVSHCLRNISLETPSANRSWVVA